MKAFSPVRPVRKGGLPGRSLGIARSKTPADDPLSLLPTMDACYSRLRELVPSIPRDRKVSRMEILQHVIDYILDLQLALDAHPAVAVPVAVPVAGPPRPPLTALNTDISALALQAAELPAGSKALCG